MNQITEENKTRAGNYFVANYPPFSYWSPDEVGAYRAALAHPPDPKNPLGLYVHIPFCRKRCHFCYFRVYTGAKSQEIRNYVDAALEELRLYQDMPVLRERKVDFVYVGGGTPSYLSTSQLKTLTDGLRRILPWDHAREIAFECEPGTLNEKKLQFIRDLGVTRLSLGVENFNEHVLAVNGRAHRVEEIDRSYAYARKAGFPQINIDLIAGMMDETDENWTACINRAIELDPDSITIYQMEIPYNTTIYQQMKESGRFVAPVADWETKRGWVDEAFARLEGAGYEIGSAYTLVKRGRQVDFLYRDLLWRGADLLSLGVASFGHMNGTHYQNEHDMDQYLTRVRSSDLPVHRAMAPSHEERMIREFVLQFKLGHLDVSYFFKKFGVQVCDRFAEPLQRLTADGYIQAGSDVLQLTRRGLLEVDRLLYEFFLPQHRGTRYT